KAKIIETYIKSRSKDSNRIRLGFEKPSTWKSSESNEELTKLPSHINERGMLGK
ncbi:hypothetical protein CHS0354_034617, partial [Potamilus streckersoni]